MNWKKYQHWPILASLSLAINGLLIIVVLLLLMIPNNLNQKQGKDQANATLNNNNNNKHPLGNRTHIGYEGWINILAKEAETAAIKQPKDLNILAGDSISLWFPPDLLPEGKTWLNQAISGETTAGLLKRLKLFEKTKPKTIFVMIGINDLIAGTKDEEILSHHRLILTYLRRVHPQTQIVLQSILPHGNDKSSSTQRDRLLPIPNERIRQLNEQLKLMAQEKGTYFLDLYPLFSDPEGNLRSELSTDGLHLSQQGYLVWASAIKLFSQLELASERNDVTNKSESKVLSEDIQDLGDKK